MGVRNLIYYSAILRRWLEIYGFELSKSTKIYVPKPEFYVVYNGSDNYDEKKLVFGNDFIIVKPKIINIHFDSLKDKQPSNSLAGYSFFYKQYEIAIRKGVLKDEAFAFAIEECKKCGYLTGVVDKEDFIMSYAPVFSYEEDLKSAARDADERARNSDARARDADKRARDAVVKMKGLAVEKEQLVVEKEQLFIMATRDVDSLDTLYAMAAVAGISKERANELYRQPKR